MQTLLKEGSRAFFRNLPIQGPTSFDQLRAAAKEYERPKADYSYMAVANLTDSQRKAMLNIHCGIDGGFAEAKYYSEIHVTFLEDELRSIAADKYVMNRVAEILNPFLVKYRLLTQDYRVGHVSHERNFYVTVCQTSPLTVDEISLSPRDLFARLSGQERTYFTELGHGAMNVFRLGNLEYLLPKAQMSGALLSTFGAFLCQDYELPLSYDLILEALRSMQIRDFKLAIVHAATALEVRVLVLLNNVLVANGITQADASTRLETDATYQGVKNRVKRLEETTREYCAKNGMPFSTFVGGHLYQRWDMDLCMKRNRAVHAGIAAFSFQEAAGAIGTAKETIVFLDTRVPTLANRVQINPSMEGYRESGGGVLF